MPFDSVISSLKIDLDKIMRDRHKGKCMKIFTEALFIIAKNGNNTTV